MYIDISFTSIIEIDLRQCLLLVKMVKDASQVVYVNDESVIWLNLLKDKNLTLNTTSMPVKSPDDGIYDT